MNETADIRDPTPPVRRPSPTRHRVLRVGRWLSLLSPATAVLGGSALWAGVMAGAGHGAVGAVEGLWLIGPLLLVVLPLLLWWPDREASSLSALAHGVGAFSLVISLLGGVGLWMDTFGHDERIQRDTQRLAQGLSITAVDVTPVSAAGVTVGYRFIVHYELAHALARDAGGRRGPGAQAGEAVRFAMEQPDLMSPPTTSSRPRRQDDRMIRVMSEEEGAAAGGAWPAATPTTVLPAGRHTLPPMILVFPGIARQATRLPSHAWCRRAPPVWPGHLGEELGHGPGQTWVVGVTVRAPVRGYASPGSGVAVYRVHSAPFELPFDAARWREGFAALGLPVCAQGTDGVADGSLRPPTAASAPPPPPPS